MTLTRHGHHIPGTTRDDEQPNPQVYRCGGPNLCGTCSDECRRAIHNKQREDEALLGYGNTQEPTPDPTPPAEQLLHTLEYELSQASLGKRKMTYGQIHRRVQDIIRIL